MDRYQLGSFRMTRNPSSGDLMLLVRGPTLYKAVLSRAFSLLTFSRTFEDRFGSFDWGTYIRGASPAEDVALADFCKLLQSAVFIADDLDESFALLLHTQTSLAGGFERSEIGNLVYEAKPYDRTSHPGNPQRAVELATRMVRFIQQHPTYRRSDLLMCVPPSNVSKGFDLPTVLVEEIGRQLGRTSAPRGIRKPGLLDR